jgi:hypothetical protein
MKGPYANTFMECGYSWENMPSLDLKGKMGITDYIDFIKVNDMKNPVMKYVDKYGRPGVAIHIVGDKEECVLCPFQRYYENENFWSYGWYSDMSSEINKSCNMKKINNLFLMNRQLDINTLKILLNGKLPGYKIGN